MAQPVAYFLDYREWALLPARIFAALLADLWRFCCLGGDVVAFYWVVGIGAVTDA